MFTTHKIIAIVISHYRHFVISPSVSSLTASLNKPIPISKVSTWSVHAGRYEEFGEAPVCCVHLE